MHRLIIDAVQSVWSADVHKRHKASPSTQCSAIRSTSANGITTSPTQKSANAKETSKKLAGCFNLRTSRTANIINALPIKVAIIIRLAAKQISKSEISECCSSPSSIKGTPELEVGSWVVATMAVLVNGVLLTLIGTSSRHAPGVKHASSICGST